MKVVIAMARLMSGTCPSIIFPEDANPVDVASLIKSYIYHIGDIKCPTHFGTPSTLEDNPEFYENAYLHRAGGTPNMVGKDLADWVRTMEMEQEKSLTKAKMWLKREESE